MKNQGTVGLVLEGGGVRGMYTAGVLDVFLEHDICTDLVVGVSAGALFGVNYLSKQKGRVIRYNKKYNRDRTYMGFLPLLKEGNIISTEYAYNRVPRHLEPFDNDTFKASSSKFYAVITNTTTGKPEYVQITDVFAQMDVLRASGSMPLVSRPVEINGNTYLDGAIGDNIPYVWAKNQGMEKLIVVLTRDTEYRKKPMAGFLCNRYRRQMPAIAEGLCNRHTYYNQQIETLTQWEQEGKAFVIRPSEPVNISRLERDPDKLQKGYDLGRKDALSVLEELQKYLEK